MMTKEIAGELGIDKRTVDTHLDSIYTKLGKHNRTEATLWATANGYGARKAGGTTYSLAIAILQK